MQDRVLRCLLYLGFLYSTYALFAEIPVTGEWEFKVEKLPDGNIMYRPYGLQAAAADPHSQCDGFSYNNSLDNGPSKWGKICVSWAACAGNGGRQSPIDIITSKSVRRSTGSFAEKYQPRWNTTVINEHEVVNMYGILLDRANTISGGPLDDDYELLSFHYHIPSEHTVDGVRYPLELHLVHRSLNREPPELAVVGLFFEKSDEFNSTSLAQFTSALSSFDNPKIPHISTTVILTLHNEIFPVDKEKSFFTYPGSLTTPPCAEIVTWLVMETPLIAGTAQIEYLKSLIGDPIGDNSRPVQPVLDRVVTHYFIPATHPPAALPPGGVAAIVLVLLFVFFGAIAYCSLSLTKEKRIIFCGKVTSYEFLGYFNFPFVQKASGSINAAPGSDQYDEEEEEEEEGIKEAPKSKGKPKGKTRGGDDEEEEEEQQTRGGGKKKSKAVDEEEEDEERPKDKKPAKKSGGYGGGDDEDFDAPSSKKTGRGH